MGAVNIIDPLANPKAEPLTKAYKEGAAGYEELGEFHEVKIHRDITNQDERFLYIVNQMLVKTRDHAIDHEKTGEAFHGAALVRTKSGKFYAAPNIHLTHQKTTRQCAEVNAITAAINAEGQDVEITDLWFEGGKTNLDKGISILPDQLGKRFCPCPSCRDVIWNNKNLEEDTKVHLLPINDGKWHLIPDDGREELEPNQVMTRNIRELFPQRNARLENITPKEFKQVLETGGLQSLASLAATVFFGKVGLDNRRAMLKQENPALKSEEITRIIDKELRDGASKPILNALNNLGNSTKWAVQKISGGNRER